MSAPLTLPVRPIDAWPDGWRDDLEREPNPFRSTYDQTLVLLGHELEHLEYRSAHIQLDVDPADIRRDGQLRTRARVRHPGVILTVDTPDHGVLVYPCDTFTGRYAADPPAWQINLRAIALALTDLRRIDRYGLGGGRGGQQYAGFAALPPGQPSMTVEEAARYLADEAWPTEPAEQRSQWAARLLYNADLLARTYRAALKRHHPDHGGDPDTFHRVSAARALVVADVARRGGLVHVGEEITRA